MSDIVTNADDVYLKVDFEQDDTWHNVVGQDFSITSEQTIGSISGISQNKPKGLTKGDLEYSFSFTIQGADTEVMKKVSDSSGDAKPFNLVAKKMGEGEDADVEWEYSLTTCLADTEEISGTTDEAIEMSVEGMSAGFTGPSAE